METGRDTAVHLSAALPRSLETAGVLVVGMVTGAAAMVLALGALGVVVATKLLGAW